jgi:hypothetical protein
MTRSMYGPTIVATPGTDPTTLTSEKAPVTVARTEGGAAETDLMTVAGAPGSRVPGTAIASPDPNDLTGAVAWFGPDGYTGSMWVKDPATSTWFEVYPVGLVGRIGSGAISQIQLNGATITPSSGTVNIALDSSDLEDVTAIGQGVLQAPDKVTARTAIGAAGLSDIPATPTFETLTGLDLSTVVVGDNVIAYDGSRFVVQPPQPDQRPFITQLTDGDPIPPGTPPGLIAYTAAPSVQFGFGTSLGGNGAPNVQSVSKTLTSPVAAGTLVVIGAGCDATGSTDAVWTVTDSRGNAYTLVNQTRASSTVQSAELRCRLTTSLQVGDTITVDCGSVRNHLGFTAATAQNTAVNGLDKTAVASSGPSVTSLVVGPTPATTQTSEIAFATFVFASNATTFTPSNGWIQAGAMQETATGTSRKGIVLCYKILTATGTVTASGDLSAAQAFAGVLGTWKKNLA